MTETAAPQLLTAAEVADRLKVKPRWVLSKTKAKKDADGNVLAPALVTPLRLSANVNAKLRFTEADVMTLQQAMKATAGATSPGPGRRRSRRRRSP